MSYRISTYDPISDDPHDGCAWIVHAIGLTLWQLRGHIRFLRGCGYEDDVSILVEQE